MCISDHVISCRRWVVRGDVDNANIVWLVQSDDLQLAEASLVSYCLPCMDRSFALCAS